MKYLYYGVKFSELKLVKHKENRTTYRHTCKQVWKTMKLQHNKGFTMKSQSCGWLTCLQDNSHSRADSFLVVLYDFFSFPRVLFPRVTQNKLPGHYSCARATISIIRDKLLLILQSRLNGLLYVLLLSAYSLPLWQSSLFWLYFTHKQSETKV